MPAGQGKDAEQFAAAADAGTPPGAADDAELARELEIVAMLRSRGAELAPDVDSRARAKQRLMAVLAEQAGPRPARNPAAPQVDAELTAPLGRLVEREDVDPAAETTVLAPIGVGRPGDGAQPDAGDDDTLVGPIPMHGRRGGRARHSIAERRAERARSGGTRRSGGAALRRRVVLVSAAAAAAMIAIAGGGVLASGDSLPGDSLYPVKRVTESTGLALTFDDADRARRHLEIAATRLSEVEQLTARDTRSAPAPEVYTTAMDEFDTSTDEGSRMLLAAAETDTAGTATDDLHTWASEQSERLTDLRPALPPSADADTSMQLLERLLGQTGSGSADQDSDSDSQRSADEDRESSEAGATDSTEVPSSTSQDEDRSRTGDADEPSRTPSETSERADPQLLPDLLPDANREDEPSPTSAREDDEEDTSTSEPESDDERDDSSLDVPLPLLPPVTLPPLLPGLPGITIG